MKRGGYAITEARQILFFHPRIMERLLQVDPSALLEAPLKFAILELSSGKVIVHWTDPAATFARYKSGAFADLGKELAATCEEIVTTSLCPSLAN